MLLEDGGCVTMLELDSDWVLLDEERDVLDSSPELRTDEEDCSCFWLLEDALTLELEG